MAVERILIIGGSGSGKTTLARLIGQRSGLPVHNLDDIARLGGGSGPERSPAERAVVIGRIVGSRRWVAEGIHLGWTDDLLAAAEVIIWLDHVDWPRSSGRLVKRFVRQAIAEARRQHGWRRFLRFRDYGRRLLELLAALPEPRGYHRSPADPNAAAGRGVSRAATAVALARYEEKLVHCRSSSDIEAALALVLAPVPAAARDGPGQGRRRHGRRSPTG
jgi:hypothetical protein